jgi:hypothetical protein
VAEGSNSMIQSLLKLCRPKTESSIEKKIHAFILIRNKPKRPYKIQIERNICGGFIIKYLIFPELAHLMNQGWTLEIN